MATDVPFSAVAGGDYAVEVQMDRPQKQSRLLLLFRGFLMIPHMVFAMVVILVAFILILVNFLSVLITGRAAFFGYLSGTLRYMVRLQAYSTFLTDAYPPFSLGEATDYPVRVSVATPGKIHRWRVFSYLLCIPHIIVLYALVILAALCSFLAWFSILFTGHYPAGLYKITSSAVRYQARVNAYLYLITDEYPPFSLS
jgi:uncharacterized protein DUF4389